MGIGENVGENVGENTGQSGYQSGDYTPPEGTTYFSWDCESDTTSAGSIVGYYGGSALATDEKHTGTKSMKSTVIGNDSGNQSKGAEPPPVDLNLTCIDSTVYFRTWVMWSSDFDWGSGTTANVKTSRANNFDCATYGRYYTGHMRSDGVYFSECEYVAGSATTECGGCLKSDGNPNNDYGIKALVDVASYADGQWHEWIIKVQTNSASDVSDAEMTVWVDGTLEGSTSGWLAHDNTGDWTEAWAGWMITQYFQMNDPTNNAGGTVWVDDISVDSVWNSTEFFQGT